MPEAGSEWSLWYWMDRRRSLLNLQMIDGVTARPRAYEGLALDGLRRHRNGNGGLRRRRRGWLIDRCSHLRHLVVIRGLLHGITHRHTLLLLRLKLLNSWLLLLHGLGHRHGVELAALDKRLQALRQEAWLLRIEVGGDAHDCPIGRAPQFMGWICPPP